MLWWPIRFGLGGRSRGERILRRTWLMIVIGIPAAWFLLWLKYRLAEPAYEFNWVQQVNAPILKNPLSKRAWPFYSQALGLLPNEFTISKTTYFEDNQIRTYFQEDNDLRLLADLIEEPLSQQFRKYLKENRDAIRLILEGTQCDAVGVEHPDSFEQVLDSSSAIVVWPRPDCDWQIQIIRQTLRKALYGAVAEGTGSEALPYANALLKLCHHYAQLGPFDFAPRGANQGLQQLAIDIGFIAQSRSEIFSDKQLEELVVLLSEVKPFRAQEAAYTEWIENALDCLYSSDGRFTRHGVTTIALRIDRDTTTLPDSLAALLRPVSTMEKMKSELLMPLATLAFPDREAMRKNLEAQNRRRREIDSLPIEHVAGSNKKFAERRFMEPTSWSEIPVRHLELSFGTRWTSSEQTDARLKATIIAVQLQQFRRTHDAWPTSLKELETVVPMDPFGHQPLQYEVCDDRPYLWSLGEDTSPQPDQPLTTRLILGYDWQLLPIEDWDQLRHP